MHGLEKALRQEGFRVPFWRTYGRPLIRIVVFLILIASIAWCARWLWVNYISTYDAFAIRHLEYHSNGIMDKKYALEIMEYDGSGNMLSVDVDAMEERLMSCTAISTASVKKYYPSTLLVEVDVRIPVAWVHCPGAGVRAYDLDHGMFVDSHSVVFTSLSDIYGDYKDVPVLQIPTPPEGEIKSGTEMKAMEKAVELILTLKKERKPDHSKVRIVKVRNEWSYQVEFDDDCHAVFGLYEIPRQVDGFYEAVNNARKMGKKIKRITLLPERNIPVIYDGDYEEIPVAEPVE